MRMKNLLAPLCLALALVAPIAQAQLMPTESLDGIIAVVDENVILRSELDTQVEAIVAQYAQSPQTLPPRAELERQVLDRMIMTKLQVARAESTGIKVSDAQVDDTVQKIAAQNRMQLPQLQAAIIQQGMRWEQFRANVHEESMVRALRQRVIQTGVQVNDSEIDLFLANGGGKRGELHLGHIQVTLPEGANANQIAAVEAKVNEVSQQLRSGMDFTAAAIRYSDAANALEGGDLGWRSYDELPSAFGELADKLQPGQVSDPIRGPNAFHIIKLIERRAAQAQYVTEYHARHILIRPNEIVSSAQAEQTVRDLRARILAGEDFAKLAREYSNDVNSANLGGDLGWFARDAYGDKVGAVITSTPVGEISEPFETDAGWHILQLQEMRTEDRTADADRNRARQAIGTRKAEEEYASFLRQLRSEAYIEIRLPGATGGTGTPG